MFCNENLHKNYDDYLSYISKPISDTYSTDNGLHEEMCEIGFKKGYLITFGKPINAFRSVDISEIVTENGILDTVVASHSLKELKKMRLPLSINFDEKYKNELLMSYILNSSLCYVEIIGKGGKTSFFATKSYPVLLSLSSKLSESDRKKKPEDFKMQLTNSYSELSNGVFQVVKLVADLGGFRLSKCKINCRNKEIIVLPIYSIGNYVTTIFSYLKKHKAIITYTEDGVEKNLATSLEPSVISKLLGTNKLSEIDEVIYSWQNPFNFAEIILPNLYKNNCFSTVSVLSIKSIKSFT